MLGTWLPARGKFATVSILPVNEPQHLRDHVRTSQKPCVILLTTLNGWIIDGWIDGTQKHLVEWVCTIWFIVCLSSWSWPRTVKKEIVIFKSTMVIMKCYVMLWTALSFKWDREWKEAHKRGNATSLWQTWNLSKYLHDQIFVCKNFTHWKRVNRDYFCQQ